MRLRLLQLLLLLLLELHLLHLRLLLQMLEQLLLGGVRWLRLLHGDRLLLGGERLLDGDRLLLGGDQLRLLRLHHVVPGFSHASACGRRGDRVALLRPRRRVPRRRWRRGWHFQRTCQGANCVSLFSPAVRRSARRCTALVAGLALPDEECSLPRATLFPQARFKSLF